MKYVKKVIDKFDRSIYTVSEVLDTWTQEVKEFQTKLLTDNGYLPVFNETGENVRMSMFGRTVVRYEEVKDDNDVVTGYNINYTFVPTVIKLSQIKLLSNPVISSKLPELMEVLKANETLKDWWVNNLTYVRGSEVAQLAMQAFGFTQEKLERIVLSCRA